MFNNGAELKEQLTSKSLSSLKLDVFVFALLCVSAGVMYWGDAYFHRIERANINGTGRQILRSDAKSRYYAFALHADYIYYTDWNKPYVKS